MSLTGAAGAALATANPTTGLLVSVPVSNASQMNQLQAVSSGMPASLGTTQTVVLTTAGQQGQAGSMLSLPIGTS